MVPLYFFPNGSDGWQIDEAGSNEASFTRLSRVALAPAVVFWGLNTRSNGENELANHFWQLDQESLRGVRNFL